MDIALALLEAHPVPHGAVRLDLVQDLHLVALIQLGHHVAVGRGLLADVDALARGDAHAAQCCGLAFALGFLFGFPAVLIHRFALGPFGVRVLRFAFGIIAVRVRLRRFHIGKAHDGGIAQIVPVFAHLAHGVALDGIHRTVLHAGHDAHVIRRAPVLRFRLAIFV